MEKRNLPTISTEEAYSLSLKMEPRNPQEAVEKLLIEEARLREEVRQLQVKNAELEQQNQELLARISANSHQFEQVLERQQDSFIKNKSFIQ